MVRQKDPIWKQPVKAPSKPEHGAAVIFAHGFDDDAAGVESEFYLDYSIFRSSKCESSMLAVPRPVAFSPAELVLYAKVIHHPKHLRFY